MSIDYLVSISVSIETQNFTEKMTRLSGTAGCLSAIEVAVHYVPDRLILDDGSINEYFNYYQENMPKQIE